MDAATPSSNPGVIPVELVELCRLAAKLPEPQRAQFAPLTQRLCQRLRHYAQLASVADRAVDKLHLEVKYLLFDLDATRRERDEYRRRLERRAA